MRAGGPLTPPGASSVGFVDVLLASNCEKWGVANASGALSFGILAVMETGHVEPTSRDIELTDLVRFAVDGASVREDPAAEEDYVRLWWQIRLNHRPKVSLLNLAEEAHKTLDPLFTLENVEDTVYIDHPDLSRRLELRLR